MKEGKKCPTCKSYVVPPQNPKGQPNLPAMPDAKLDKTQEMALELLEMKEKRKELAEEISDQSMFLAEALRAHNKLSVRVTFRGESYECLLEHLEAEDQIKVKKAK